MKRTAWFAGALVLGTGASMASAQTTYQGSDTLEALSRVVTTACGESPAMTYVGGGSTTGESAMLTGTQDIAPMSRELNCNVVDPVGAQPPKNACQINVADDALGVWRSPSAACNNIPNARDTLRLIYFGLGPTGNGSGITLVNGRMPGCNGADATSGVAAGARQALVSNWNTIFGCAGSECASGLRHAFRRDDLSGTTDVFRDRLGVSTSTSPAAPSPVGVAVVPFCNGNDVGLAPYSPPNYSAGRLQQDLDPIRVTCNAAEDVCGPVPYENIAALGFPLRTLGVVLSVVVPTSFTTTAVGASEPAAAVYNPVACTGGQFRLISNPHLLNTAKCPDGSTPASGNLCYAPVRVVGAAVEFNCTSGLQRAPSSPTNFDGRLYNTALRDAAGNVRLVPPAGGLTSSRRITTAFYRLHALGGAAGPSRACNSFLDSTQTIGCFTAADACSIGYAGFEGNLPGGENQAVSLNSQAPLANPTTPNTSYLLYRKLWINALHCPTGVTYPYNGPAPLSLSRNVAATGLPTAAVDSRFSDLFQCFRNQGTAAAVAAGFFAPVGANGAPAVQAKICPAQ